MSQDAGSPPASTPSEQLEQGFRWLRFSPGLEAAYRTEQFRDLLGYLRVSLALLAALILAVNQIDRAVLPAISSVAPRLAGIGVMPPLLLLGLALTFAPNAAVWYPRVMAVAMAVALVVIGWVVLLTLELGESRVFVRLIIATIAIYFVLGLPVRAAVTANVAGAASFVAVASSTGLPAVEMQHYVSMLLMAGVICAVGAYALEHASRTAWLEARMLAEHALHDGLTGLCNRRRFDDHLERAWQQGTRDRRAIALLFGDLDFFKKYNDRYGHQAGDEALKAVAGVLARHARRPFDMAARFGGEEFAVLLYDASGKHAAQVAENILREVRGLGIVHEDSVAGGVLTISIGIACVQPEQGRSAAGLLQLADQALYAAKDGGRDQARVAGPEYEQMQTGYFHRRMFEGGAGADGQ
ncbi:MAG: GGDEF domain-containing protein [Steroidobacteraceae bacterium]|nr:GGDEF domain-containing protein [Steroidobacteraceae bacterium]